MNTPISFKIAKLLKEKGFDSYITSQYIQFDYGDNGWKLKTNQEYQDLDSDIGIGDKIRISAPTITEVVMWLYEKHGVWIWVEKYENDIKFNPQIPKANLSNILGFYNSPTEAYSSAIEYTLKNLI